MYDAKMLYNQLMEAKREAERKDQVLNWILWRFSRGSTDDRAISSRKQNTTRTVEWALGNRDEPSELFKEWRDGNTT